MDVIEVLVHALAWLKAGQRWDIITMVVCLAAVGYVAVRMILRAREERRAARAVASNGLRIMARRYHESAWS